MNSQKMIQPSSPCQPLGPKKHQTEYLSSSVAPQITEMLMLCRDSGIWRQEKKLKIEFLVVQSTNKVVREILKENFSKAIKILIVG